MAGGRTDTRLRLENAAADELLESGWAGATARAITSRAQLPLGSIHYHFGSTPALVREGALVALARIFEAPAREAARATSPQELLTATTGWLIGGGLPAGHATFLLETLLRARSDPDLSKQVSTALREWRRGVAALLSAMSESADRSAVEETSAAVTAFALGLLVQTVADPGFRAADAISAFVRTL